MNCLKRNKKTFYYGNPFGDPIECRDEYGNLTGERIQQYGECNEIKGNISQATGVYRTEEFGGAENYDRVILIAGTDCPITETSALFLDKLPTLTVAETYQMEMRQGVYVPVAKNYYVPVPDYIVWRISKSLNYTAIAVKKVKEVGYGNNEIPYK